MVVELGKVNEEAIEIDTLRVMSFVVRDSLEPSEIRPSPGTVALSGDARVPTMLKYASKSTVKTHLALDPNQHLRPATIR